jgi:hypothetical protein
MMPGSRANRAAAMTDAAVDFAAGCTSRTPIIQKEFIRGRTLMAAIQEDILQFRDAGRKLNSGSAAPERSRFS